MKSTIQVALVTIAFIFSACDSATDSTPVVASIEISSSAGERANYLMPSGQEANLGYSAKDESDTEITNTDVSWSSSNSAIVSVDANGTILAGNPGKATITVSADGQSDSVELTVYNISGSWQSQPYAGNNFVTLDLTQNADAVTGTFTYSGWTSSANPDVGRGPITGTLFWDRFVHQASVAQGCVWNLAATIAVVEQQSDITLMPTVETPAWTITPTCSGIAPPLPIASLNR